MDRSQDETIAGFYAAAAGERRWPDALTPLLEPFDAWAITLFGIDLQMGAVDFSFEAGHSPPEASIDYIRVWHRHDPRGAIVQGMPVGPWGSCHHHFDDAFVERDPFFQQFLIPYGGRWTSGGNVYRDERVNVVMSIHRAPETGPLPDTELPECERLGLHMGKALSLWLSRRQREARAALGMEIVQRLPQPVAIVDAARRIVGMNPAAQRFLAGSPLLRDNAGSLCARNAADDARLLIALRSLHLTEADAQSQDRVFIGLGDRGGNRRTGVCLLRLAPSSTMGAFGPDALAMIMFHDADSRPHPDSFVLAAMYDLSPAEARVATALCAGEALADIAQKQKVSIHTVRSQVKAVFDKTGCSRQAELVGKLAGLPQIAGESGASR